MKLEVEVECLCVIVAAGAQAKTFSRIMPFARSRCSLNSLIRKIVIDKSAVKTKGNKDINRMLKRFGCSVPIKMVRIKFSTIWSSKTTAS
nr:hypothetical protein [Paracoccus saliphilus]